MKLKKLFGGLFLSFALIAGVGAGLLVKENRENAPVEKAEAAGSTTITMETTIYLNRTATYDWFDPYINFRVGSSTWRCEPMNATTTANYYYYDVPADTQIIQFDHANYWKETNCYTAQLSPYENGKGLCNYFEFNGRGTNMQGSWGYYGGLYNNISYNNNGGSGTIAGHVIYLDNANLNNGSSFSKTGHTLSSWNTKADGSGTTYALGGSAAYQNFPNYKTGSSVTLFAQWTINTYTITYDRNNNGDSSATRTETKTYGVDYTIANPTKFSWSPSTGKRFVGWADSRSGQAAHQPGDSYTTDAPKTYYYNEDWYNYQYKINSGSWVDLPNAGSADGFLTQFAPSSDITLSVGDKLYFQYSTNGKSTWNSLSVTTWDGNYNSSTGVKLQLVGKFFLKLGLNGTSYTCYVAGTDRTIAVFNSPTATTGGTEYSTSYNTSSDEYVTTILVTVEKGQYVRRGYMREYNHGTWYSGGTGDANGCFERYNGEDNCALCLKTGVYTFYNQRGTNDFKDIWVSRDESASAKYLAQKFNTVISAICSGITGGTKSLNDLKNAWFDKTTSELYKHFNGQVTATLNLFKTVSPSDSDMLACVQKYDYILNRYGTSNLSDFLGRKPTQNYPTDPRVTVMFDALGLSSEANNGMLIAIIAGIASATAVGGYFFLRKRRNEK